MIVLNRRRLPELPQGAVYVGRPTPWGNPYPMGIIRGEPRTRRQSIELFRSYADQRLRVEPGWLEPLRGAEYLVCWCAPLDCHADVLVELLEAA